MPLTQSELVEVRLVKGKGRGVFARRAIRKGDVIERVPVLVLAVDQIKDAAVWGEVANYVFQWGEGTVALALGYGSLYNHSYRPNARYDDGARQKVFTALRDVAAGEEITINYNGDPDDPEPVGFEVLEQAEVSPSASRAQTVQRA
ncbi:MAG: SET domain-containing protein [Isosphaeraceae bacterium]